MDDCTGSPPSELPEIEDLTRWVGRTAEWQDVASRATVVAMLALDPAITCQDPMMAPLLSHWGLFHDVVPLAEIDHDGHPKRGGFLPPVQLPRRMWAGSGVVFERPIRIGVRLTRRSVISAAVEKTGRNGRLCFVSVDHEVLDKEGVVLTERQDIVYRDRGSSAVQPQPVADADVPEWSVRIVPDPVLLFRYSAWTANGHRIHYDRPYSEQVEGYGGLVVQGPLLATLILHHLMIRPPGRDIAGFAFRAIRPVIDTVPFLICGTSTEDLGARLWVKDMDGGICMTATATFRRS